MTARTLKRLERAAMRWYRLGCKYGDSNAATWRAEYKLTLAAYAHAQRKGAKRKGR